MESDRAVIIAMLTRAGVNFTVYGEDETVNVSVDDQPEAVRQGYYGFGSELYFNADGSLKTVGAWE